MAYLRRLLNYAGVLLFSGMVLWHQRQDWLVPALTETVLPGLQSWCNNAYVDTSHPSYAIRQPSLQYRLHPRVRHTRLTLSAAFSARSLDYFGPIYELAGWRGEMTCS